jgi:hypothetical protein
MAGMLIVDANTNDQGRQAVDAASRLDAVATFNLHQCQAALDVPGLQKSVEKRLRAHIRKLEKV